MEQGKIMARTTEEVGLILVHGIGEQVRFDHLRSTAHELASLITDDSSLIRLEIRDQSVADGDSSPEGSVIIDAIFRRDGGEEQVRLHLREVWWADLGIKGGLIPQLKFWLWGLGQWAAQVVRVGDPRRNTSQLMTMPRFGHQRTSGEPPTLLHRFLARLMLFFAGILAFLTFFTWSAAKRIVAFLANSLPQPSLIFLFLGDVKTYEEPAGRGGGTLRDPDQPIRTTIRRRMASEMLRMAAQPYKRWYIFAHSLGTVPAFNLIQETELALPNYLTEAEWKAVPDGFKTIAPFKPAGAQPSPDRMMPRRPPWLSAEDGIDRRALFEKFAGFVTYGCPLDKFATLWPRVVPLNRQAAVFPKRCEWINLHDPADPVSGALDAFACPLERADAEVEDRIVLAPQNAASRAGLAFGLSHIRYFRPRPPGPASMPGAVVKALTSGGRTTLGAAARSAALGRSAELARGFLALVQLAVVATLLLLAAGWLLVTIGKALPDWATDPARDAVGWLSPRLVAAIQQGGLRALLAGATVALAASIGTVFAAGIARGIADYFRPPHK
jgi:hypothetical protein